MMIRPGGGSGYRAPSGGGGYHPSSGGGGSYHPSSGGGGSYHPSSGGGGSYHPSTPSGGYTPSPGGGGYHPSTGYTPSPGGGGTTSYPSEYRDSGGTGGFLSAVLISFVLFVVFCVVMVIRKRNADLQAWASATPAYRSRPPTRDPSVSVRGARRALEALRERDPEFSIVLFEDFVYALYTEVHRAHGAGKIDLFGAYLAPAERERLARSKRPPVTDVVVGTLLLENAYTDSSGDHATYLIESNYTEGDQSYAARERWTVARQPGTKTRVVPREKIFDCPSCGAPQEGIVAGTCGACHQPVATGAFDWVVAKIEPMNRDATPPVLTGDAPEEGTDLPTVVYPEASEQLAAIGARDPSFDWKSFKARVQHVFSEFQVAWAARDLARMRPLMSDRLFGVQTYWVEQYRKQGLCNVLDHARVLKLELSRVTRDAAFDAITVRLTAAGSDYTVRLSDGFVVGGSRARERKYTEYWTFIRGASRSGPAKTEKTCPACGAPLQINMAGSCEYCRAHVTSGEFDWVLSRIEQDESYEG